MRLCDDSDCPTVIVLSFVARYFIWQVMGPSRAVVRSLIESWSQARAMTFGRHPRVWVTAPQCDAWLSHIRATLGAGTESSFTLFTAVFTIVRSAPWIAALAMPTLKYIGLETFSEWWLNATKAD